MINNSSVYWKETYKEIGENFCQCGNQPENVDLIVESNTNPDFKMNSDNLSNIVMQKKIDTIFKDKSSGKSKMKYIYH